MKTSYLLIILCIAQMPQQALPAQPACSPQSRTLYEIYNELNAASAKQEQLESNSNILRFYLNGKRLRNADIKERSALENGLKLPDANRTPQIIKAQLKKIESLNDNIASMNGTLSILLIDLPFSSENREKEVNDWQAIHDTIVKLKKEASRLEITKKQIPAYESDDEQLEGAGEPGGPQRKPINT